MFPTFLLKAFVAGKQTKARERIGERPLTRIQPKKVGQILSASLRSF